MPKPTAGAGTGAPRSAVGANPGSGRQVASSETVARPKRRTFPAAEKLRIVEAANACAHGELAALLRREGVYSSQLTDWRRQLNAGNLASLAGQRPGRKAKLSAADVRMLELQKENAKLKDALRLAEAVIELQKKAHAILGIALPTLPEKDAQ